MSYRVLDELDRLFPGYLTAAGQDAWQRVKLEHPVQSMLTGRVVARFPFGVFLDAGIGFPILLLTTEMSNLTPEEYRTVYLQGKCCVIGEEMSGRIAGFNDNSHQIGLSQRNPDLRFDKDK